MLLRFLVNRERRREYRLPDDPSTVFNRTDYREEINRRLEEYREQHKRSKEMRVEREVSQELQKLIEKKGSSISLNYVTS